MDTEDKSVSQVRMMAVPVKFAREMFIINAIEVLNIWLEANAPPDVQSLFQALDWAVDYAITAAGNDGEVYAAQYPDSGDLVAWLQAIYQLTDKLGYSLDVA